tara:strand:+ start:338 stop:733 length:396 start_codon:yes stop_codon:yes gene_type:complete
MKNTKTKTHKLECIVTYNKEMYESDDPNKKCMELIKNNKYKEQRIFSVESSKDEILEYITPMNLIVEVLYKTDLNFKDIWKVSMCVYHTDNNKFELPKWFVDCGGQIGELQKIHNEILKFRKENEVLINNN